MESENSVGVASHPIPGKLLKNVVIPDTITLAQKIGLALRTSKESELDPVFEILKAGDGFLLFEGLIAQDIDWKDEQAYTVGEFQISGSAEFDGLTYKIWFKNENIVSWLDNKPDASAQHVAWDNGKKI